MSIEHLEQAGITLPREQWGKRKPHSTVNRPLFLTAAAGAAAAGFIMYWGGGGIATWVGAMLFLVSFFAATAVVLHSVTAQCQASSSGGEMQNKQSEGKPQS